jgi:hypothetical protein
MAMVKKGEMRLTLGRTVEFDKEFGHAVVDQVDLVVRHQSGRPYQQEDNERRRIEAKRPHHTGPLWNG